MKRRQFATRLIGAIAASTTAAGASIVQANTPPSAESVAMAEAIERLVVAMHRAKGKMISEKCMVMESGHPAGRSYTIIGEVTYFVPNQKKANERKDEH